jgi:cell division protein ZipA
MNVPCVSQPASMFDRMIETAKRLCRVLDGQLLDQDRKPLTDKGIGIIRAQIDDIGDSMRAFGIVAGSPTALRLFGTEAN